MGNEGSVIGSADAGGNLGLPRGCVDGGVTILSMTGKVGSEDEVERDGHMRVMGSAATLSIPHARRIGE
jgi:hypothetical protein